MNSTIRTITSLNLRDAAGLTASIVQLLPPGTELVVFGQPIQADGLTWLEVGQSSRSMGWIAQAGADGISFIESVGPDTRSPWERCIEFVLRWEGGLSLDPNDPGNYVSGRFVGTKYGISAASFPSIDIPNLTIERAKEIYAREYWRGSGADKLPWPLCLQHFDATVLSGAGRSNAFLIKSNHDPIRYAALRLEFYTELPSWPHHGKGWVRRVADALKVGG